MLIQPAAYLKICPHCLGHARIITAKGEQGEFCVSRRGLHASLEMLVLLGKVASDEAQEVKRQIIENCPLPFEHEQLEKVVERLSLEPDAFKGEDSPHVGFMTLDPQAK